MKRNITLDLMKGIGIFLVVLGHATFVNDKLIAYVFSFHIPLFFIVSGMLMYLSDCSSASKSVDNDQKSTDFKTSFMGVLKKKANSIIVPYCFFSIIYTIIDFISVYFKQIGFHDLQINAACSLSFGGSGPLWFLPTLFLSEIILYLITRTKSNTKVGLVGLITAIVGFVGCYLFAPVYSSSKENLYLFFFMNWPAVILRSMLFQVFLVPGYLLGGLFKKIPNTRTSSILQVVCGVILLLVNIPLSFKNINPDLHNLSFGNPIIFVVCAYLGTIGLYLICNNLPDIKLLSFWGRNSLVIMITHLNFYYLFAGNLIAVFLNQYITRAKSYFFLFNILWVAMLLSSISALLINRFAPWMLGRKKASR